MKESLMLHEEDLPKLAKKVSSILEKSHTERARVILLEGDLGAGKTTFTKALAHELAIDGAQVHSPTFILKKEYKASHPIFKKLIHIDAYRFNHPDEGKVLRLEEDLKDEQAVVVIEWPSNMHPISSDIDIAFSVHDETTRDVTITYEESN